MARSESGQIRSYINSTGGGRWSGALWIMLE